jgi:phosphoribosylformimino-5-aminoimidazole carboxamide ribotide isomerase
MLVLPAIDIYEGKCIRLRQGDYAQQTVYSDDPAEVARKFAGAGLTSLHLVDLEGAKERKVMNWKAIESVLAVPGIRAEVGGGLRTTDEIRRLLDLGAERVVLGSVAAKSPELIGYWVNLFTSERITIGVDVKNHSVAISGWLEDARLSPAKFIYDMLGYGARRFVCTDITRDGLLQGPNVDFYRELTYVFHNAKIVASGGVTLTKDIEALKTSGVSAVIIGKALYEGTIRLEDLVSGGV